MRETEGFSIIISNSSVDSQRLNYSLFANLWHPLLCILPPQENSDRMNCRPLMTVNAEETGAAIFPFSVYLHLLVLDDRIRKSVVELESLNLIPVLLARLDKPPSELCEQEAPLHVLRIRMSIHKYVMGSVVFHVVVNSALRTRESSELVHFANRLG